MRDRKQKMKGGLSVLLAEYFKVLSEPRRLGILNSLKNGEMSVNEIAEAVRSTQPNVSGHLRILMKSGFVSRRPEKNTVYYSIADQGIWDICEIACRNPDG